MEVSGYLVTLVLFLETPIGRSFFFFLERMNNIYYCNPYTHFGSYDSKGLRMG